MTKAGIRAFLLITASSIAALQGELMAAPSVLYTFSAPTFPLTAPETNMDGIGPATKLVLGSGGFLYGTTSHGGAGGAGTIFRVTTAGAFAALYSFPAATNSSGEVVFNLGPNDLTQGTDGYLYGTTQRGGSNFDGTVFMVSQTGSFTNLHTFGAEDGATPTGALAEGSDGNFYGTTQYGGDNGAGTIFRISPAGAFASLYSFRGSVAGVVSSNAAAPNAMVLGSDGVFYGTTGGGGGANSGVYFRFFPTGGYTQIYSFTGPTIDGSPVGPNGALAEGANGEFYGTSRFGGSQQGGCIFEITVTNGPMVLHSFPELSAGAGAALAVGVDGNIYGTTAANGLNGNGSLFRLTPGGGFGAYSFAGLDTNLDNAGGANPLGGVTVDGAGNLYGTRSAGGTNGSGVIFQVLGSEFIPPYFVSVSNSPPASTNVLTGASIVLAYDGEGIAPLAFQWLKNGTNLIDGGDIQGSLSNTLQIRPVFNSDAGAYALVISNTWGALTSAVTIVTLTAPVVSISSPAANSRTAAPVFAGTATNAPTLTNVNASAILLTQVTFILSNLFDGSVISGSAVLTAGTGGGSNWLFAATPAPGTNVLSVEAVDASGNRSPAVSRTFFYEVPAPLTVQATGSGTGTFNIANGAMLDIGEGYSVTARPNASLFVNWDAGGVLSFAPTLPFVMESNLVLRAYFLARQSPGILITNPAGNARTASAVFGGTAQSSPVLGGVDPTNVVLTTVTYWLTNAASGSVITGSAALTSGSGVSNWTFTATPEPGTNIVAVQAADISGEVSRVVSRTFFYKTAAAFGLLAAGTGNGTVAGTASVRGDTPPTNGAMLNIGERYTVIAQPDKFSTFNAWVSSTGSSSSAATLSFIMQPNLTLTATFNAIPPRVSISSPSENQRTATPVFDGTVSSPRPIAGVTCSLAGVNGSASLSGVSGTQAKWSIALVPDPGSNTLTVYGVDANGNKSAVVSRRFFYKVPSPLTVDIAGPGNGTVKGAASIPGDTPPANGAMLNLGESYAITAIPDKSSLFSNWVSSAGDNALAVSTGAKLSFVMASNLVLTANFESNFFPAVAGAYNGLFFPDSGVTEETSGMLYNLVLGGTGAFSGQLLTAAANYHFASSFDATGNAAFHAGPLQVAVTLDTATPQITGSVSGAQFTANLIGNFASNALAPGNYYFLFVPTAEVSAGSPSGDGYALVTNRAGIVTLNGALADGTRYNQTVPVSQNGDVPVYARLNKTHGDTAPGLLLGWINLTNQVAAPPVDTLTWIKKPSHPSNLYTNGFTNILAVQATNGTGPPPSPASTER